VRALTLTFSQVRYVNKAFWRNPTRAFFTFAFPLMFLIIFTSLLGGGTIRLGLLTVKVSQYYVAAMAAYGVIMASYNYVATSIVFQRESGILKRTNGTPLPSSSFLAARVIHSLAIGVLLVMITAAFGRIAYGVPIPTGMTLLRLLIMLAVGAGAFCALALALTAAIPDADASQPIVMASMFPLLFLSGIFIAFGNGTPAWILWIARIFPVRHFALGLQAAFLGTPFAWTDVAIVAAWGIAGLLVAIRYFRWEPGR
jgi:ABC-2 type transport system permease protein